MFACTDSLAVLIESVVVDLINHRLMHALARFSWVEVVAPSAVKSALDFREASTCLPVPVEAISAMADVTGATAAARASGFDRHSAVNIDVDRDACA